MTALVQFGETVAMIENNVWYAPEEWQALLNGMLDPNGPSGADPNPDLTAATDAAAKFGGKVTSFTPTEWEPGVIY